MDKMSCSNGRTSIGHGMESDGLPSLTTRKRILGYITSLAGELGVSLDDSQLAEELDKRDQLAKFRSQFHIPTVGELIEEGGYVYRVSHKLDNK